MNVNVDAKGIHEIVKELPYKYIMLLISVISALLIFLPDLALEKMFLLELRNKIGTFLGVIFIISACVTLFLFISPIIRKIRVKRELSGRKAKKKIEDLTGVEKQIIAYMYSNQETNIVLPSTNSTIVHLKTLLMITEASSIGNCIGAVQLFPFFLQQWVITTVDKYPELLKGVSCQLPYEFERYRQFASI